MVTKSGNVASCPQSVLRTKYRIHRNIPKPVWAVGFAHEQTLRDATLPVFSFANFKTASA
ncbi:MAG: hypothetical protein LBH59_03270 [Planctomycetaceae bacterium]|nr:hypothetical protein [Planctomycetaceae bacterium]